MFTFAVIQSYKIWLIQKQKIEYVYLSASLKADNSFYVTIRINSCKPISHRYISTKMLGHDFLLMHNELSVLQVATHMK